MGDAQTGLDSRGGFVSHFREVANNGSDERGRKFFCIFVDRNAQSAQPITVSRVVSAVLLVCVDCRNERPKRFF